MPYGTVVGGFEAVRLGFLVMECRNRVRIKNEPHSMVGIIFD